MSVRRRCSECGRSRPEEETALVPAKIGGDYRRSWRRGEKRVCVDCTRAHVEYVRRGQADGRNVSLNNRINWERAAKQLGVELGALKR